MRLTNRYTLKGREGETRVRRKFLWLPRHFETGETRWLEWADVVEQVLKLAVDVEWGEYEYAWRWCEVGFADTMDQEVDDGAEASDG